MFNAWKDSRYTVKISSCTGASVEPITPVANCLSSHFRCHYVTILLWWWNKICRKICYWLVSLKPLYSTWNFFDTLSHSYKPFPFTGPCMTALGIDQVFVLNGNCYWTYTYTNFSSWETAEQACTNTGGHLATIDSDATNTALANKLNKYVWYKAVISACPVLDCRLAKSYVDGWNGTVKP